MATHDRLKRRWVWVGTSLFIWGLIFGFLIGQVTDRNASRLQSSITNTVLISPVYPTASVFDRALSTVEKNTSAEEPNVRGLLVNHHLLAADFIADTFRYASGQDIDRIILLAPNHFFAGHGFFITTSSSFSTPYGQVATDRNFIESTSLKSVMSNSSEPFIQEHGIYNVLPFIKKQFPDVPIVPIITRDGTPPEKVDQLRQTIGTIITERTLVIASLDFAHEQTNEGAAKLDGQSIAWLQSVDPNMIQPNAAGTVAVDSPMTLRLFLGLLRDRGATDFTLLHHSNSALETGHLEATDVTSHITGRFSVPVRKE